jgi:hypothetical protein
MHVKYGTRSHPCLVANSNPGHRRSRHSDRPK